MTIPLKDMSNDDLDLALGPLMGWKEETVYGDVPVFVEDDGAIRRVLTWRPTTNLEHSKEVQAKAIATNAKAYAYGLTWARYYTTDWKTMTPEKVSDLMNATPREVAEAAYMVFKGAQT